MLASPLAPAIETRNSRRLDSKRLPMAALIMFFQQVQAEIAFDIAPDRVDVVGAVLRVVVLDEKHGRLDAIVMRLSHCLAARPRKIQIATGFLDLLLADL